MDANDLGRTVPRLREDSPGQQMSSLPPQLPDVLIYCGILLRLPFRLFIRLAVACKAWRHRILGGKVRRLLEDSPGRQIASPAVQLPDDLICLSILPRLPFRQLLLLTPVCKAWRQLILGDPAFARMQARCPSPASAVLARYHGRRLQVLSPSAVGAAVAPPDASLSFLPVGAVADTEVRFCSVTSGLLCLMEKAIRGGASATIFVVNPATRAFRAVPYAGDGRFMPCLAYDPSMVHRNGYHIVVPAQETLELRRFWSFSSAASGWRVSRAEVRLTPYDFFVSKPLYLGGRAHWLCERGGVVWHDARADAAGALPPPGGQGLCLEGRKELVAWHGRIGIVSAGLGTGLAVWALSSSAGWEMVHRRSWDEIPGVAPPASCFMWSVSVVPAGMEGGAEKELVLGVRMAHGPRCYTQQHGVDGAGGEEDVWRRELLRYDIGTGATAVVAELVGKEKHDDFGAVFSYHSSMAPLD